MKKKTSNSKIIIVIAVIILVIAAVALLRFRLQKESGVTPEHRFSEHIKEGNAAFFILGDYFHEAFANELGSILLDLPPDCKNYIACSERMRSGLTTWTAKENLPQPTFYVTNRFSAIMKIWARDVVISGIGGEHPILIVAPNIHARTEEEAGIYSSTLRQLFPEEYEIILAPFAFEGGNLIFIERGNQRILLAGKKLLFDNARYQRRQWTPGWSGEILLEQIRTFFHADSIVVMGLANEPPPLELYFEYHLDMGITVLRENTAVVAEFPFGADERRQLREAIDRNHPVIGSLFEAGREPDDVFAVMSERLASVQREYDHYAEVAQQLGLKLRRTRTEWLNVVGWISWTNVLQAGTRILMPIYPHSPSAVARTVRDEQGRITKEIDIDAVAKDQFELTGYNLQNQQLYESLGYQVILIPEYLHYFEGGLHCFVNILN